MGKLHITDYLSSQVLQYLWHKNLLHAGPLSVHYLNQKLAAGDGTITHIWFVQYDPAVGHSLESEINAR